MNRLGVDGLAALPAPVARPDYDIGAVRIGIVHLGLGAFHRAHQAVYTDAILHRHALWGICGVSLKTPRVMVALTPQDGLYTVLGKSAEETSARVIGSVREMLFLGTERDRVIARIADPAVRVVSLTVTEKGYCHDPATGRLDLSHADIVHDLACPEAPVSAVGVLAAGLAARREAASGPLNVVCCDNLPHNGRTVEGIVAAYAQASDPALAEWIGTHVAFPVHDGRPDRAGDDAGRHRRGRAAARRRRCRAGCRRAVQQLGHRGPLCRRAPALGGRRRTGRRRRRAVRDDEAAPPERQPLDARLPRLSFRARVHLAGVGRPAARDAWSSG